ncbi:hypothetical protein [Melissospora conviva]|uniref:hypothetical protein n=1 Tax=Melissospora conviva TaxID=3388432 RepID=UPI003C1A75AE
MNAAQERVAESARLGRPGGAGGQGTPNSGNSPEAGGSAPTIDDFVNSPQSVAGRSAEEIAQVFRDAGYDATVEQSTKKGTSGNAVQVRIDRHPEVTNVQVHPGGGRHTPAGSPYWKISTSTKGKIWVVPADFKGADQLNGTIIRYE